MKRALVIALLLMGGVAHAQMGPTTPQARIQLDGQAYAGMPFGVVVVAEGFDENPTPAQPTLSITGATVTPTGADPQIQRISVNGKRFDSVTWVFRYRVEAAKPGKLTVPSVTVTQGSKTATAQGGDIEVTEIATTDDMRIELELPDRALWLGESAEVHIDWLLRRNVGDQQLAVPLLSMPKDLGIAAPPADDPRQVLSFPAGATDLQLPFVSSKVTVGGTEYTRFRFTVLVTPLRAGSIAIAPAQVVASLVVGQGSDQFGFPKDKTQLFRAIDTARTLEVKPLPQTDRPASFAGAVGSSFSIATRTSRSVVSLGEPVDLEITVKSDQRLDGLVLGALGGPGRLPADKFTMPDTLPPGVLSDDGKTKTFQVAVQVVDPATDKIPAIELAWFDPASGQYRTTKSEPIALSVKGGTVVSAGDVIATKKPGQGSAAPVEDLTRVDVDLALSAPGAATDRPLHGPLLWAIVGLLYLIPIGLLVFRHWRIHTATSREEKSEVSAARRRVDDELARARTAPARDVAAPLCAALRGLARVNGAAAAPDDPLLAKIETEGFAPDAAEHPLPEPLRKDAAALAARLAGKVAAVAILLFALTARADTIDDARADYQTALAEPDPTARQAAFARAEGAFGEVAATRPHDAELLADWGNAALGAADFGTATLAYRRALLADPDHARSQRNLRWLRLRLGGQLTPAQRSATATLLFWQSWSHATRYLLGGLFFAFGILALVPWRKKPGVGRILIAVVPFLIWINLTISVLFERAPRDEGVVLDAQVLRSADAALAPPAQSTPLPPGAEVTILELRSDWTRVRTATGTSGWLPTPSVAAVKPR